MPTSEQILEIFLSRVTGQFSFLTTDWGFVECGAVLPDPREDPRDRKTRVRYFRGSCIVDVVLNDMALGLFVYVRQTASTTNAADCQTTSIVASVSFEYYLLSHHKAELSPPLPGMKPHQTFLTMYNKAPFRYHRIIVDHLPDAIAEMASRFRRFGKALIDGDLVAIAAEP